jgi:hypothetical protein
LQPPRRLRCDLPTYQQLLCIPNTNRKKNINFNLQTFYFTLYRIDAQKLEEWARTQNSTSLVEFSSKEGEIEGILKDIAQRAGGKGEFSYSRFFAVGLFRLLELANATEPTILDKVAQFIQYIMHDL